MNINDELGKRAYSHAKCVECGRTPKQTRLNIEGSIHHSEAIRCIERKECERLKRKQR